MKINFKVAYICRQIIKYINKRIIDQFTLITFYWILLKHSTIFIFVIFVLVGLFIRIKSHILIPFFYSFLFLSIYFTIILACILLSMAMSSKVYCLYISSIRICIETSEEIFIKVFIYSPISNTILYFISIKLPIPIVYFLQLSFILCQLSISYFKLISLIIKFC